MPTVGSWGKPAREVSRRWEYAGNHAQVTVLLRHALLRTALLAHLGRLGEATSCGGPMSSAVHNRAIATARGMLFDGMVSVPKGVGVPNPYPPTSRDERGSEFRGFGRLPVPCYGTAERCGPIARKPPFARQSHYRNS